MLDTDRTCGRTVTLHRNGEPDSHANNTEGYRLCEAEGEGDSARCLTACAQKRLGVKKWFCLESPQTFADDSLVGLLSPKTCDQTSQSYHHKYTRTHYSTNCYKHICMIRCKQPHATRCYHHVARCCLDFRPNWHLMQIRMSPVHTIPHILAGSLMENDGTFEVRAVIAHHDRSSNGLPFFCFDNNSTRGTTP